MSKSIGQPIVRNEDLRLITGTGEFSDDRNQDGQAYAAMLRSPHAHAIIENIDRAVAETMPGVLLVMTGEDWQKTGLPPLQNNPIPSAKTDPTLFAPDGGLPHVREQYPLPLNRVHITGEAVAMVVAETAGQARDAAEAIEITYNPLGANAYSSKAEDAALLWDDLEKNLCVDSNLGDPSAVDQAFEAADHVVDLAVHVARVTGVPMEPRAALATYDKEQDSYALYAGGGGALRHRTELAKLAGVPDERMRVICGDVGGNYGTRNRVYPEFPLVLLAAKILGRPVKWTADRTECMLSDLQGRDLTSALSLALDKEGRFLALRGQNTSNTGGYTVAYAPLSKGAGIATGPYDIQPATLRLKAVVTNTPPTNPYRSAGRPECVFALERIIDTAARELGFDRVELRRKNLIQPDQLPYENPQGMLYDSGEFERALDIALKEADYANFDQRRDATESTGMKRGIGIAPYIETSSGAPMEWSSVSVLPNGVNVAVGTQSSGQGHETSFAQVAADWLGIPFNKVLIQQGNTDVAKAGNGSHAGRSMRMAGTAIVLASNQVIEKGKVLASFVLETAIEDIEFADGEFRIQGTDRAIDWFALAGEAERDDLPDDLKGGLNAELKNVMHEAVFPNGCHVCEVVVDPETGTVVLERYTAVDDVGRVINPLIVDGQIHGGIVQGAGQALMERCFFDEETAQPYAGSFMDYAMPRASDMPSFSVTYHEVLSPQNPLGVKSGGESGTTPAPAVIINAVVDALYDLGVRDIEMPASPHRVWQAIQDATTN
ncbi:MAG: carbon monoxide dehydrogenase [Rhodospirillaceae bacterium]|nr:carbon monoxide dehydrogenase [Rhodospirillaceae bacterium]|tara:strand:- start:2945 stop:5272 length:2328 start_codon:yes stop_codon:yes gene_type:complete